MKLLAMFTLCATLAACSSAPKEQVSTTEPTQTTATPVVAEPEHSEVLARKEPGAVKCPKKARLVKGKCILPVEETE